ncbi:hypothetical protein SAMN04488543_2510 [Friedmanniella luteola]|uniref:Uncharacterized protein n=1 Tax=Friedmanniella luteola TaxID=546871 RepID=A0A1H1VJS0_9ACTN|nr:hypothetical protein SAMN04488543_2510 [Friedmanniella luteola]
MTRLDEGTGLSRGERVFHALRLWLGRALS